MKIDLTKYKTQIVRELAQKGFDSTETRKVIVGIEKLLTEKLPCTKCGKWLLHEAYHLQASAKNRYGRISACKACQSAADPRKANREDPMKVSLPD